MNSETTPDFWKLFWALPKDVRKQALVAYRQFKKNPNHSSLQFKLVNDKRPLYSARIGIKYRALGLRVAKDRIVWWWIGSHADYDKILKK